MTELDELERDLRAAGDIWFRNELLAKLERLIAIAREGEALRQNLLRVNASIVREVEKTKFEREGVRI